MARRLPPRRSPLPAAMRGVGSILYVGAVVMAAGAAISVLYLEWWTALWMVLAGAVTALAGLCLQRSGPAPADFDLRDAMTTAGAGWLAIAVFGALPFWLAAHLTPDAVIAAQAMAGAGTSTSSLLNFRDPVHALFESMSGWTTTGLTMAVVEPTLPRGLLMYRSLMQWTGGAGVIVLALSVFQQHAGVQGIFLYRAEARQRRLRPSIAETARRVWRVYAAITAVLALYLFLATLVVLPDYPAGRALFDAVNHAMTGQATGGFSTLDDSIAGYGSPAMEWIHLVPMISGAISLPVHYVAVAERRPLAYVRDMQNRALFALIVVGSGVLALALLGAGSATTPVRDAVFQFVSALTGTGWQTAPVGDWPINAALLLSIAMVIGGATGSTVGGLKLLRVIYLTRGAWWGVRKVFEPEHAVAVFRVGDRTLDREAFEREVSQAAGLLLLWTLGLLGSVLLVASVVGSGADLTDIILESASAQDTVGLSTGLTGPDMPRSVEITFVLQMWIGRLEVIPVLVFLRALLARRT